MNRDEIYDHLAQVYLGKKKKIDRQKKSQFNVWLLINALIAAIIFASATYGLTAFLAQKNDAFKMNVLFSLHQGLARLEYNFKESFVSEESLALSVPAMDASKYNSLTFKIRAKEEGSPGILKVVLRNKRNEEASYYVRNIDLNWQTVSIPLDEFYQITDWNSLKDVSFVLEVWNVEDKKGIVLIDDVNFST